jgi:energy-coupling factor transporter ATP-binding protein EcfA2
MLKTLRLVNFRAFRTFNLSFGDSAYLIGPNNAGKSTILTSLRLSEVLLRLAYSKKPEENREDGGGWHRAYPVSLAEFPALSESIRHEFHDNEARLELTWKTGAKLVAIWPAGDGPDGFFYLRTATGQQPQTPAQVRSTFSEIGIVPVLTPLEHTENFLTEDYVRRNIAGRLSSRHFRNQLLLLEQDCLLHDFLDFASEWSPEIKIFEISKRQVEKGMALDVYYMEANSNVPKEIIWAGDGFHVWLQILLHVFWLEEQETIVLDEPDVYLHSDLQRRLVRLLGSLEKQVIIATHSTEIIAEAARSDVVMIDKSLTRGVRAKNEAVLEALSDSVGSQFNLRLAKALKSRLALFVEGDDAALLSRLAEKVGARRLALESGISVIALTGYTHWPQVEPFAWFIRDLLGSSVKPYVILDRDYRPDALIAEVSSRLKACDIPVHVWRRKELESYILTPGVIARLSGAPLGNVASWLDDAACFHETQVFSRMLGERIRFEVSAQRHLTTVAADFKKEFDHLWKDRLFRLERSPPKEILSEVNAKLVAAGHKSVSARALARAHRADELPHELVSVFGTIEEMAS